MRETAQGRNLYVSEPNWISYKVYRFFHKGKLTVRLSSRIYSHKCQRKRFYGIKRKLSGVISCPELDECTLNIEKCVLTTFIVIFYIIFKIKLKKNNSLLIMGYFNVILLTDTVMINLYQIS